MQPDGEGAAEVVADKGYHSDAVPNESPELVQRLLGAPPHLLLRRLPQTGAGDRELAAKLIENRSQHFPAFGDRALGGRGVELPSRMVGCQLVEASVVDLQQPDLLEVRLCDPPPAPQVLVDSVLGNVGEGPPDIPRGGGIWSQLRSACGARRVRPDAGVRPSSWPTPTIWTGGASSGVPAR